MWLPGKQRRLRVGRSLWRYSLSVCDSLKILTPTWISDGSLVDSRCPGKFVNFQTNIFSDLLFSIWNSESRVQRHESQMLPCLCPCVRRRPTERFFEKLNYTICYIFWSPKQFWRSLGLGWIPLNSVFGFGICHPDCIYDAILCLEQVDCMISVSWLTFWILVT
jgi:hypothetical protein